MKRLYALAAWTSPALLAAIASRVAAGSADAPLLVVGAIAAPLAVILSEAGPRTSAPAVAVLGGASSVVLLWADFVALVAAGVRLGAARWQAATVVGALTLLVTCWPALERRRSSALAVGLVAAALTVVILGVGLRATPWSAWARVAARPALRFDDRARAVADGVTLTRGDALLFVEAHRVTVLSAGVYRVVEGDDQPVTRDWPLAEGDVLTLRPGDRLVIVEPYSKVRFERGRHIPGAAVSGAVWAAPEGRGQPLALVQAVGLGVTMVGAARALVPAGAAATALPVALLAFSMAATSWGVYAALVAPDVALAASPAALLDPAMLLTPPAAARLTTALAALALLALGLAAAWTRRDALTRASGGRVRDTWTGAVVIVAAAAAATWAIDPWRALAMALGVAAAVRGAPLAAAGDDAGAATLGAIAGGVAFGAVATAWVSAPAPLTAWPALAAAPLAWAVARAARTLRRTDRAATKRTRHAAKTV